MSGTQNYPPQGQQQQPPPQQQQSPGVAPPHQQQPAPPPQPPPHQPSPEEKAAADKRDAETREARAFGSIGGQVILDFNGDASLGVRGAISGTMEENSAARDAHLIALGLDPMDPVGPPPSQEALKARQEAEKALAEAQAKVQAAHATPGAGAASRVSSLAAGIVTEPGDMPDPPDPPTGQRQPASATTVSVSKTV
jgi:hypothetical protein